MNIQEMVLIPKDKYLRLLKKNEDTESAELKDNEKK